MYFMVAASFPETNASSWLLMFNGKSVHPPAVKHPWKEGNPNISNNFRGPGTLQTSLIFRSRARSIAATVSMSEIMRSGWCWSTTLLSWGYQRVVSAIIAASKPTAAPLSTASNSSYKPSVGNRGLLSTIGLSAQEEVANRTWWPRLMSSLAILSTGR